MFDFLQILGDKERLIKRTQLRRAAYKVLGKVEKKPQSEIPDDIDLAQVWLELSITCLNRFEFN